ncbi:MAG: 50S ribosome-binding GTPase [bacterium]|nr:50S ribosome-binding GTPase [bacterium]MDY4098874.1 GTPase [Lachnospiraceae bacterium]
MEAIDYSSYRLEEIQGRLAHLNINWFDIMITGVTGAGKSTTLNSFLKKTVANVGMGVDPETQNISSYELNEYLHFWDTPGLGDGVSRDQQHKTAMKNLLQKTYPYDGSDYGYIDMCIVILEGQSRDLGTTRTLLNDVVLPNIQADRIIVAINQADFALRGQHWDKNKRIPDHVLLQRLEEQASSVQYRVKQDTGITINKPVYYSALYDWNVVSFIDEIINQLPIERRQIMRGW